MSPQRRILFAVFIVVLAVAMIISVLVIFRNDTLSPTQTPMRIDLTNTVVSAKVTASARAKLSVTQSHTANSQ